MFLRTVALAILALVSISLTSCIDGREEIWLNPDGSGRAHFTYDLPATAAKFQGGLAGVRELLDSLLVDFPSSTHEVTQQDDRLKVDVKLSFANPDEITKIRSAVSKSKTPESIKYLTGIFEVERKLRTVDFTRTVSPGKAFPTAFIPASEFANRKLTYILHLPVVPTESTADRSENGGLTQIWEQPLASAIRKPVVIHFKANIPVPRWLVALVGGVAILVAGSVIYLGMRMRRRFGSVQ